MDFKKYVCPVCNNAFNENDDVVVCPDCGTPHHRECWNSLGKCFNNELHGSEIPVEIPKAQNVPEVTAEKVDTEPERKKENKDPFGRNEIPDIIKTASVQSNLIEGKPSVLYEIAVGKNQKYYIPRFMLMSNLKKGISWNFFAFLAPLSWTLYRKMYKFAAIFFALYLMIFGITGYYIMTDEAFVNSFETCMQEDPQFYTDVSLYLSGASNVSLSPAEQEFIKASENINIPVAVNWGLLIVPFVMRTLAGLFGNREYMKKLRKNIDDAEKKGLMGDDLKNYLYRKYGTLPLIVVVLIGIFEWQML